MKLIKEQGIIDEPVQKTFRGFAHWRSHLLQNGRGEKIRTSGPLFPKQVR